MYLLIVSRGFSLIQKFNLQPIVVLIGGSGVRDHI